MAFKHFMAAAICNLHVNALAKVIYVNYAQLQPVASKLLLYFPLLFVSSLSCFYVL